MSTRHRKLVKVGIKNDEKKAFSFGNVFTNYFLSALAQGKRRLRLHSIISFKRSAVIKSSSLQVHPTQFNP